MSVGSPKPLAIILVVVLVYMTFRMGAQLFLYPENRVNTFLGYSSGVTNISEEINLTKIMVYAKSMRYETFYQDYIYGQYQDTLSNYHNITISAGIDGQVKGYYFGMDYDKKENLTIFSYRFPVGTKGTNDWLWNKLSLFMHVDVDALNSTIQSAKFYDDRIRGIISGEPDWSDVRRYSGDIITRDSTDIGQVIERYVNGTIIYSSSFVEVSVESYFDIDDSTTIKVKLNVLLDGDGDVFLRASSLVKLPDPSALFISVFQSLNLPTSSLSCFSFKENLLLTA